MKNMVWSVPTICILGLVVLSGCTSPQSAPGLPRLGTSQAQATIQTLQRRLHESERTITKQNYQIEILSGQLNALKQIDQDTRVLRQPVRNLIIVTP